MVQSGAEALGQCVAAWACLWGQLTLWLVFSICMNTHTQTKRERTLLGLVVETVKAATETPKYALNKEKKSHRFDVQSLLLFACIEANILNPVCILVDDLHELAKKKKKDTNVTKTHFSHVSHIKAPVQQ